MGLVRGDWLQHAHLGPDRGFVHTQTSKLFVDQWNGPKYETISKREEPRFVRGLVAHTIHHQSAVEIINFSPDYYVALYTV